MKYCLLHEVKTLQSDVLFLMWGKNRSIEIFPWGQEPLKSMEMIIQPCRATIMTNLSKKVHAWQWSSIITPKLCGISLLKVRELDSHGFERKQWWLIHDDEHDLFLFIDHFHLSAWQTCDSYSFWWAQLHLAFTWSRGNSGYCEVNNNKHVESKSGLIPFYKWLSVKEPRAHLFVCKNNAIFMAMPNKNNSHCFIILVNHSSVIWLLWHSQTMFNYLCHESGQKNSLVKSIEWSL